MVLGLVGRTVLPLASVGLLVWPARASGGGQEAVSPPASIQVAESITLSALLDLAAAERGLNLDYPPELLTKTVKLRTGGPLTGEELWLLVSRLLASEGLTTIQRPGESRLTVVKLPEAAKLARVERGEADGQAGYLRLLYRPQHQTAEDLAKALEPLLQSPWSQRQVLGQSNVLLIADLRPSIQEAYSLLADLDRPGPSVESSERRLVHRSASSVLAQVERVVSATESVGGEKLPGRLLTLPDERGVLILASEQDRPRFEALIELFDRPSQAVVETYPTGGLSTATFSASIRALAAFDPLGAAGLEILPDPLTGSVLVRASPELHASIQGFVEAHPERVAGSGQGLRSFALTHRSAKEILERVTELMGGLAGVPAASSGSPLSGSPGAVHEGLPGVVLGALGTVSASTSAGVTTAQLSPLDPTDAASRIPVAVGPATPAAAGLSLSEDPETNRLIASGPLATIDQLAALIEVLDVPTPQVLLEALVVTLTEAEARDVGVELQKLTDGGDPVQLGSLFGLGSPELGDSLPTEVGQGFTGVVLSPGNYSALLRAFESKSQGRSLSRPRVLVANNSPATLESVIESPFLSTNASDTVATTSFGGASSAGTTISVTPTLVEGDKLALDYTISVSTFVGESADPALPPPRQQNRVQSRATIPDGFTVVVGGLELENRDRAESRIPILGSIPLIGELFKSRSKSEDRTRFFVFLRAKVERQGKYAGLALRTELDLEAAGLPPDLPPRPTPRLMK